MIGKTLDRNCESQNGVNLADDYWEEPRGLYEGQKQGFLAHPASADGGKGRGGFFSQLCRSDQYLAGQFFKNETFPNVDQPGSWHVKKGRDRILRWIDLKAMTGFAELDSNLYYDAKRDCRSRLMCPVWYARHSIGSRISPCPERRLGSMDSGGLTVDIVRAILSLGCMRLYTIEIGYDWIFGFGDGYTRGRIATIRPSPDSPEANRPLP